MIVQSLHVYRILSGLCTVSLITSVYWLKSATQRSQFNLEASKPHTCEDRSQKVNDDRRRNSWRDKNKDFTSVKEPQSEGVLESGKMMGRIPAEEEETKNGLKKALSKKPYRIEEVYRDGLKNHLWRANEVNRWGAGIPHRYNLSTICQK